jgi:hypothetical protein
MTLHAARPICYIWEHDNGQASIDELNQFMEDLGQLARVGADDSGGFRATNNVETWPLENLPAQDAGTVLIVYVDPGQNTAWLRPVATLEQAQLQVES